MLVLCVVFVVYEGCQHVTHFRFVLSPWLLHLFCSFCPSLLLSLPSVTGDWQLWGLLKTCQPLLIWTVKGDWEKSRYGPLPSSAPWAYANTHMHTVIIRSHWLLCFLTEKKLVMPKFVLYLYLLLQVLDAPSAICRYLDDNSCSALIILGFVMMSPLVVVAAAVFCGLFRRFRLLLLIQPIARAWHRGRLLDWAGDVHAWVWARWIMRCWGSDMLTVRGIRELDQ